MSESVITGVFALENVILTVWLEVGVGIETVFVSRTNDERDIDEDVSERLLYEYLNV